MQRYTTLLLAACTISCAGGIVPRLSSDDIHVRDYSPNTARCTVALSHSEPLVTEWTASSKARLEALLNQALSETDKTAIAVRYTGCELKIVDDCRPHAEHDWAKTTLARDAIEIQDTDELYAKLPLGAANLEGALKRSGHLTVQTTVAGQIKLRRDTIDLSAISEDPKCAEATHLVSSVTIGAFKMTAGGYGSARGEANVGSLGAGGNTSRAERLLREAGAASDCEETSKKRPNESCRSPIQLFLLAVPNRIVKATFTTTTTLATAVTKPPETKPSSLRTLSYILGGVGLASLGGGTASFVTSNGIEQKIQTGTYPSQQDIVDAHGTMSVTRTLGATGLIAGAVLLGVAVPFFVIGGR